MTDSFYQIQDGRHSNLNLGNAKMAKTQKTLKISLELRQYITEFNKKNEIIEILQTKHLLLAVKSRVDAIHAIFIWRAR